MLRQFISSALIASTLAIGTARATPVPTPDGYSQFMTYVGNGTYNYADASPVKNCQFGGFCFDDYFGRVVQRRTADQELAVKAQAKQYFEWKYGIDVDSLVFWGAISFQPFTLDPRVNYRAYVISGMDVPAQGYEVRDGGYIVKLNRSVTFGGDFLGQTYPAGTLLIFGENNILAGKKQIVVSYRFRQPVVPGTDASGMLNPNVNVTAAIELRNGSLLTTNFGSQAVKPEGLAALNIGVPSALIGAGTSYLRTVLTFSTRGGL